MAGANKKRRDCFYRGLVTMETEQAVVENIKTTVQNWVDGKVDKAAFGKFLAEADRKLDAIAAEKAAEADKWWRISTSFYY